MDGINGQHKWTTLMDGIRRKERKLNCLSVCVAVCLSVSLCVRVCVCVNEIPTLIFYVHAQSDISTETALMDGINRYSTCVCYLTYLRRRH